MPEKNLKDLPIELVSHISSFLDHKSLAAASMGDKEFYGLFSTPSIWKYRLIKDFDIDSQLFANIFPNENKNNAVNYKQLYSRFYCLNKQPSLPKFIKIISRDITQHHLVLLAFADNVTCLEEFTREQQYLIAVLAIYAGCFNLPYSFLAKHIDKKLLNNFLYHASDSGNLKLVKYLLNPRNKLGLTPDAGTLQYAAQSGNLQLVLYLLNPENKFGLKPNMHATLYNAAKSGNLQLVEYLLNPKNKFRLKPDDNVLNNAAQSGNLQLIQYLLKAENKFGLKPGGLTLYYVALSGNLQLIQYLITPENNFGLTPDGGILYYAARSGNLQLVQYLLNPKNKFELTPDGVMLNNAAQSGNLQLMQYLLNPENKFGLTPDGVTLNYAAQSGNLQLVQYLLNPKNKFELTPNDFTLNHATQSGNLQLMQYLLNTDNNFGLKPNGLTLYDAASTGNLQLVQYLLNPNNQFGLEVTQHVLNTSTVNFALSGFLLPSHLAFQYALEKLQAHDITEAKSLLQQSYTACPTHHNMMLQYILNNPQGFHLSESAMQYLQEYEAALLEDEKISTEVSLKREKYIMQEKNLIKDLPIELVSHISSFLDHKSLAAASLGDKAFYGLFNTSSIWKDRLIKNFNIDAQLLCTTFPNEIKNNTLNYKQLYVRFYYLSQQRNLPKFIKSISRDITQHHLILLACTDNVCLEKMTREQQYTIAALAIYASCFNIPRLFLERFTNQKLLNNFLDHASQSGHLKLVQYLLNAKNKFCVKPTMFTLNAAVKSGNLQLVQYLLNPENKFRLKPDDDTLDNAAQYSNLRVVQYFLNPDNNFGLIPNYNLLNSAASSGNLQLVQYLLNPKNKFKFTPNANTLIYAAGSGNLQLMQYLLNPDNNFGLKPNVNILNSTALSGNLQLVLYLLDPKNKFELTPDGVTLNCAAQSGNLQLVQYLLNPDNQFGLKPQALTLCQAASSGNLQLEQYLLNSDNQIHLILDHDTLDNAAVSGNLQLVQYFLNPDNKFSLIPSDDTLWLAARSGSLQLVQYFLNPDNQFDIEVTQHILETAAKTTNFALSEYLLPSHSAFQNALEKLQTHDINAAKILLKESYTACPSHYNMMLQYTLIHTQRFNLCKESIQCLHEIANKSFLEDSETAILKKIDHCILI